MGKSSGPARKSRAEVAGGDIENASRRIDLVQRLTQPRERERRRDEIDFRQRDPIGERDLSPRLAMRCERRHAIDGIDDRRHAGDLGSSGEHGVGEPGVQDRRGVGEAGRLQYDASEGRHRARVASAQNVVQAIDQIAAQRAAEASRSHQDHVVGDGLEQEMIEADLAPFVDDDERPGEFGRAQQAIDQRRLARAEKARDDVQRNSPRFHHGPTGINLPTKTGAPEGLPSGEPPFGSTVTA